MRKRIGKSLLLGSLMLGASVVAADPICDAVLGFDVTSLESTLVDRPGFDGCNLSDNQPQTYECRWMFSLGALESREIFVELNNALMACEATVSSTQDMGVNHPDFYDAYFHRTNGFEFFVSLKDKSGLGRSFVVLRGVRTDGNGSPAVAPSGRGE